MHRLVSNHFWLAIPLILAGCGLPSTSSARAKASELPTVSDGSRAVRDESVSDDTPGPTQMCVVALEGKIHGTVARTSADAGPVYVTVIFSGGPTERQKVRQDQYELPLLARRCADGVHWVRFGLSAVGVTKGISPVAPDVREDLEVGDVPASVPSNLPDCILTLGMLNGKVVVHQAPAPLATPVMSAGPPGAVSLDQQTQTDAAGRYSLPVLGVRCGSDPAHPLISSVEALGIRIPVAPNVLDFQQDIEIP